MNDITNQTEHKQLTSAEIKSAMQVVFPSLLPNEYELGCKVAQEFGLNPLKREIYLVGYGEGAKRKLSIIIGYEVFLKRAERIGTLDGWKCETLMEDDEPVAKVTIWRKDRKMPFEWSVTLHEYEQRDYKGDINKMWSEKPKTMLKKVCIAQAFRLCFPEELGGLPYIADELPSNMTPPQEETASQATQKADEPNPVHRAIETARKIGMDDDDISSELGTDDWEAAKLDGVRRLCEAVRKIRAIKKAGAK